MTTGLPYTDTDPDVIEVVAERIVNSGDLDALHESEHTPPAWMGGGDE